ncbi:hypothetical protein RHGRI_017398 [Rhododendron griersonianum]|uniref:Uncharacterized protein n=1 Tax=Rhododendron griersonianum TaxID=479676 RepID=A0AAV6JXP9_9ERIC|nr:hypothetical protein RHGRI_017398 [Rhododendron griersonianum]
MERLYLSPSSTLPLKWCVSWGKSDQRRWLSVWCQCQQVREAEEQHYRRTHSFPTDAHVAGETPHLQIPLHHDSSRLSLSHLLSSPILRLARSHCGRQALLAVGHFLEAVSVLIAALQSIKELDPDTSNSGSPLSFIFKFWSNRKDAPTWLLEWVDASIVYHRKGATGLLQYIALLAFGGDPHMASTSILLADTMDVENMVGDSSTSSDGNLIENLLGKPISENSYRAAVLRDSSVAQMTTTFRILAFISENSAVATALYDEGAVMVMVIHAVLIDCRLMLERCYFTCDLRSTTPIPGQRAGGLIKEGRDQLCHCYGSILKDSGNIEQDREASLLEFLGFPTSDSKGDIRWGQGRDGLCVQFLVLRSTLAWVGGKELWFKAGP